ncbi:MAG: hypothetical protein QOE74_3252 [Mycobacterium sp.]|nr:hypothetical protein [Mycobacterium sp.]
MPRSRRGEPKELKLRAGVATGRRRFRSVCEKRRIRGQLPPVRVAANSRMRQPSCATEAPGATAEADAAFGILGDFVVWYRDGSTATTPGRWGDFLRTHRSHVTPAHLDGFGYFTNTDATGAIVQNPYHVRYGR